MIRVGDVVIWRAGKSKSKTTLPLGIAGCTVVALDPHTDLVQLEMPERIAVALRVDRLQWAVLADLEN